MTHALARAVAPTGRVLTFEFHAQRAQEAVSEFARCASLHTSNLVGMASGISMIGMPGDEHLHVRCMDCNPEIAGIISFVRQAFTWKPSVRYVATAMLTEEVCLSHTDPAVLSSPPVAGTDWATW